MGLGMDRNRLFDTPASVDSKTNKKISSLPGQAIWQAVREHLKEVLSTADYERWIADLKLIAEVDGKIVITARDRLSFDRVSADHRHILQRIWKEHDDARRDIRLVCWKDAGADLRAITEDPWAEAEPEAAAGGAGNGTGGNDGGATSAARPSSGAPEMTFGTLVTGKSNAISVELAKRVADGQPVGTQVHLISGPQGTGKTHTLLALRTRAMETNADATVVYLTAEEFLSAYTDGVKAKDTSALKKRLRSATILLIDDLHRISGKPGTETELFQNIREVTGQGGNVVLAGDKTPGELAGFSPRMMSELKGATVVEVALPDEDMRRDIIRRLARHIEQAHPEFVLDEALIERIHTGIRGPGRELTGAVWNLFTEAGFGTMAPTSDMLERVIRRMEGEVRAPTIELVKKAAMKVFNVSKADLESPSKARSVVYPRQIAMYLCREQTHKSFPQIGRAFGRRDHTTVLYAHRKLSKELATDQELAADIARVAAAILEMQAAGNH
ncbi:chromosomal replication initiator protein DnaA [Hyphomonas jannaschiana VP2]|uniref:Chromosomal replication initiator protein DnaA n=2 Tax=Hyphomonas jannaschiana TaxID=86 RepID=A0A059FKY9_9PROT|nr:chromosomal replication initiator protein DnaA [Hyphomonas jannaschiana VP2]